MLGAPRVLRSAALGPMPDVLAWLLELCFALFLAEGEGCKGGLATGHSQ